MNRSWGGAVLRRDRRLFQLAELDQHLGDVAQIGFLAAGHVFRSAFGQALGVLFPALQDPPFFGERKRGLVQHFVRMLEVPAGMGDQIVDMRIHDVLLRKGAHASDVIREREARLRGSTDTMRLIQQPRGTNPLR